MLEEQERGFARADEKVLLYLLSLLAAERRIRQRHVEAVFLLYVRKVLRPGLAFMKSNDSHRKPAEPQSPRH